VPAEGAILERILDTTYPVLNQGLSRQAFARFDLAQRKTAWALRHQRRFALVEGNDVLASAQQYELSGILDRRRVRICGIGAVGADPACGDRGHAPALVEQWLNDARAEGGGYGAPLCHDRRDV
jgi:ribosomal protein S18 acetylase RimI-like enzyme